VSRDGRFLAYESTQQSGRFEIWVKSLRDGGGPWKVSNDGGTHAAWAGGRLFYAAADGTIRVVPFDPRSDIFSPYAESVVIKGDYMLTVPSLTNIARLYDVSHDGRYFLLIKEMEQRDTAAEFNILVLKDWLRQRQSAGAR
jgi:hypothetical protein